MVRFALPSDIRVERTLVGPEKFLQRGAGSGAVRPLRGQHDTPVSRAEGGCITGPVVVMMRFGGHWLHDSAGVMVAKLSPP